MIMNDSPTTADEVSISSPAQGSPTADSSAGFKSQVETLIEAGKRLLGHHQNLNGTQSPLKNPHHLHHHQMLLAPEPTSVNHEHDEALSLPPVAESEEVHSESDPFVYTPTVSQMQMSMMQQMQQPRYQIQHQQFLQFMDPQQQPLTESTPKKRSRSSAEHTPRPSNSFMIYRREKQAEILAQYKGQKALHNNAISKVVADMWREETPEVRAEYAAKAEHEKIQHMLKYPGYKYTPRRGMNSGQQRKKTGPGSVSAMSILPQQSKSEHVQVHLLPMPQPITLKQSDLSDASQQQSQAQQFFSYNPIMTQATNFPLERHFVTYSSQPQGVNLNQAQMVQGAAWPYQMVTASSGPRFIQVQSSDSTGAPRIIQVQGDAIQAFDTQHPEIRSEYYVPAYMPQFSQQLQSTGSNNGNGQSQQGQQMQSQQAPQYRPWNSNTFSDN